MVLVVLVVILVAWEIWKESYELVSKIKEEERVWTLAAENVWSFYYLCN